MKSTLYITVRGREGEVEYEGEKEKVGLDKKPLLWSIGRVVRDISRDILKVRAISVTMQGATFSGTRQVIATVNTLAWALGIKVNGKKQMSAKYSAEPNITKPSAGR